MKIIEYSEPCTTLNEMPSYYKRFYPYARLLFFDIEATGFIAKNTTLYLIGVLWYEDNTIQMLQWFNDNGKSEYEMISAFNDFCKKFTHLVHFNGLGFDIPYLTQKADLLKIPSLEAANLTQIDIYKEIRSYKSIFALDNMKQVSIERYLGIDRQDTYSGKELISVYQRYIASPNDEMEHLLLLHNHDDLLGMPSISKILNYKAFFENPDISSVKTNLTENQIILSFTYDDSGYLPKRVAQSVNNIYLNAMEQQATLHIPVFHATLKHYFKNYKDYYYLPKEDTAIHKSIAAFVESDNKEKAKKDTCYVKKTDVFIPCPIEDFPEVFQTELKTSNKYQTLESLQSESFEIQKEYIKNMLSFFL